MVNLSQTGSLDKAVLEAMACEVMVLTSNEAFDSMLVDGRLKFKSQNIKDLCQKIEVLMKLDRAEILNIGTQLRTIVVTNHDLSLLVKKIVNTFNE